MTIATHDQHPADRSPRDAWLGRAWTAIVLIPVFFLLSFAVGEVLYSLLGYKPENDDAPLWADLVATLPALAVFLVPCVGAAVYGRRARMAGSRSALVPLVIGALAGAALVVLSLVTLIDSTLE